MNESAISSGRRAAGDDHYHVDDTWPQINNTDHNTAAATTCIRDDDHKSQVRAHGDGAQRQIRKIERSL